jgi:predicted dehydrogenase
VSVSSPDWINVSGRLAGNAEVAFLVSAVPSHPDGRRSFEIYGREGTLSIASAPGPEKNPSIYHGPNQLYLARGNAAFSAIETPARFTLIPDGVPAGPPRNVAQAYARLAKAMATDEPFDPGFAHAVKVHKLIRAIEQSSDSGKSVRLDA